MKSISLTKLWWNLQKQCGTVALLIYNSSCRIKHLEKLKCYNRKDMQQILIFSTFNWQSTSCFKQQYPEHPSFFFVESFYCIWGAGYDTKANTQYLHKESQQVLNNAKCDQIHAGGFMCMHDLFTHLSLSFIWGEKLTEETTKNTILGFVHKNLLFHG